MERLNIQTTPIARSVACEHFVETASSEEVRSMAEHLKKSNTGLWPDFRLAVMRVIATGNRQDLEIEFPEYAICNMNRGKDDRASGRING
ncbi:TPA: hypothetical protein ACRNRF_004576 [Pseudomonas aeruginosa]